MVRMQTQRSTIRVITDIITMMKQMKILDKLATETDEATLKQYYTRLNEIYLTDVPSFGLMYRPDMF